MYLWFLFISIAVNDLHDEMIELFELVTRWLKKCRVWMSLW